MAKLTAKPSADKPSKPYPDFPLFPHATRRWAKKINGRFHYFGPWADAEAALKRYLDTRDDLYAGRTPRVGAEGLTIRDLLNRFLTSKQNLLDCGELRQRTFDDYKTTANGIAAAFGLNRLVEDLASEDFEELRAKLAKTRGPVSLGNEVNRCRIVFNYAFDSGLIDRPVRYGKQFKRPSKKTLRQERQKKGPRMFEPEQIRTMLDKALPPLRAMILLGVNCGFGNHDCGSLPLSALDVKDGWLDFPRPKTAVPRLCPLWPETVEALKVAIEKRPTPKDPADERLVFITSRGQPWAKKKADCPLSKEMRKLLDQLGFHKPGLGFYTLRHVFQTIGDGSRDQVAVKAIMGHAERSDDMSANYRELVDCKRLQAVVDHVRGWLFPTQSEA